jgi:hypothetical protein
MSSENTGLIVSPGSGPPGSELPSVLATPALTSHGDGIVIAVPSLQVYSTGIELLVLGRARHGLGDVVPHKVLRSGLRVSGRPVGLLGGENTRASFTHRAWHMFRPGEPGHGDLILTLDWPGIEAAEHVIPAADLSAAAQRVTTLWPD